MDHSLSQIAEMDRGSVLHPFTHAKDYASGKAGDPTIITGGNGIRIQDAKGNSYIDGFAGLYCVNIGYGRDEVAEAISKQAHQLAYYHSYAAHTTDQLAILSDRLVRMAPGKMSKVFYGMSGSDANETQAKLVWYYNNLRGMPAKKKIISRDRGYHGCSVISGSMTGMSFYHDHMDLPMGLIRHTGAPHHYWGAEPGESEEQFSARRATELEAMILREGPDTVGAFIAEPVLGTGGITPPPAGYWAAIQAVLRKYDVLLIADEGPGLSAEQQQRLFLPFAASGSAGGSGLGLAICNEIVQALGGRISLRNRSRQQAAAGLDAVVSLPLQQRQNEP